MKRAKKIEVEGTDGAGKTTALKYMIDQLRARGSQVLETREVGNPHIPACVQMREFVLSPESDIDGASMEVVFASMRVMNQAFEKKVAKDYDYIVSDRGWFSHLAYTDHNVSKEFTEKLYLDIMAKITTLPDVVIYFSVNTETALKRRIRRGGTMDVIEAKGVGYQELVRESFEEYLGNTTTRVFRVDANQSIEEVRGQIDSIVNFLTGDQTLDASNG